MSNLIQLLQENQKLKYQLEKFKGSNGLLPYIDDSVIKGSYHVVKDILERDSIDCCYRKLGMKVLVIGEDLSFKEYILKTDDCKKNIWEEVDVTVEENEVFLIEDYSELSENLTTQKELNLILKQLILNLQTQIDNIELTDEKVQITENTDFAQIGENQKIFNKNVSIYRNDNDLKNQEQDDRLTNIEGENATQNDRLFFLEKISYVWSPTNRTLTLYDGTGKILSQVSLVSLDNEGTDLRYNADTLSLDLYNADNELLDSIPVASFIGSVGTQLQLNSNQLQLKDSQGNILSSVSFEVSNINGLQIALNSKLERGAYAGTAQDLKTEIDGKLNKPTTTSNTTTHPFVVGEDGNGGSARLPAGDLGKNFFNSDLSNTTARNHTMNAGVTVNTLGNPYSITGLPNKNADIANFRKVRVQNPSGLDSVVDSKNLLTDGMTSMTDAEKDTWRLAQRKSNENYSIGQPRVDAIVPPIVDLSTTSTICNITLIGVNLFINNVDLVSIVETIDLETMTVVETISNISVHQTLPSRLSFDITKNLYTTNKQYSVRVTHNGITSIVNSTVYFMPVTELVPSNINLNWKPIHGSRTSASLIHNAINSNDFETTITNNSEYQPVNNITSYEFDFNTGYIIDFILHIKQPYTEKGVIKFSDINLGIITSESAPTTSPVFLQQGVILMVQSYYSSVPVLEPGVVFANGSGVGYNVTTAVTVQVIMKNGVYKVLVGNSVYVGTLQYSPSGKYKLLNSMGNRTNSGTYVPEFTKFYLTKISTF